MKKINIGIVLIVLFLIGIVINLIYVEKQKEEDKVKGLEFVKEYFEVYNKYSVLEKEDRVLDKKIDLVKYNNYTNKMNNELSNYLYEQRKDFILQEYRKRLDNQINGKYMMYEYIKEIIGVDSYQINGEYILMWLNIKVTVDKDNRENPIYDNEEKRYTGKVKKQKGVDSNKEIILIKRVSKNEYKVVYHTIMDYNFYSFEDEKI